jgi:mannose-6-phosphate isomerase-like protein (cupin superfamily)
MISDEGSTPSAPIIRPWGYYIDVIRTESIVVKRLTINPGAQISKQCHNHRNETWYIASGNGRVQLSSLSDDVVADVRVGTCIVIPVQVVHRITNTSLLPLTIIEVQTGKCDELDIVRLEDDYGRA